MTSLPAISPREAKKLIDRGAILVDIREADEHARDRIPGARNVPLSRLDAEPIAGQGQSVLFLCRSGGRTMQNASRLAAKAGAGCDAFIVAGGLDAWKAAGLPVLRDPRRPIDLQRQVQIGAGALVFSGTLLGLLISPYFLAVPLFVGGGLMTAGVTGFCGMAHLLMRLPWNRAT